MAIADVIKYEGDNSTFVWKHPVENFNTNTQLIVHESQEAVFFLNGQPMDLFGSGRYTLQTENLPLLRHAINLPTRFILSIKRNKWPFAGAQTARYNMWSLPMAFPCPLGPAAR